MAEDNSTGEVLRLRTAVAEAAPGSILQLGPGPYYGGLKAGDTDHLRGVRGVEGKTRLLPNVFTYCFYTSGDFLLENLDIDCGATPTSTDTRYGIRCVDAENVTIRNVSVRGANRGSNFIIRDVQNLELSNIDSRDVYGDNHHHHFYFRDCANVTMENVVTGGYCSGTSIRSTGSSLVANNCNFIREGGEPTRIAVFSVVEAGEAETDSFFVFNNCTFKDWTKRAVDLYNSSQLEMHNCTVENSSAVLSIRPSFTGTYLLDDVTRINTPKEVLLR